MVALCDESLIDKVLEDKEIVIDIKNYSDFYKGDLIPSKELSVIVSANEIVSANVIGRESVDAAIGSKVIDGSRVKTVNGVPYAHAYKIY
jgi:hypothetical protein